MNWKNIVIGLGIVLLAAGAIYMNLSGGEEEQTTAGPIEPDRDVKPQEGFAAPDFELETLDDQTIRLYENNGKPTLINFWASWCGPCKIEMPHLQEAYEQYGEDVNFLMVNLTFNDQFDTMTQYLEQNGYTFPILLDEEGDVATDYLVMAIPTTYVVDENGVILQKIQRTMSRDEIQSIFQNITR